MQLKLHKCTGKKQSGPGETWVNDKNRLHANEPSLKSQTVRSLHACAPRGSASHIPVEKEGILLGRVGLDVHSPDHLVQLHDIEAGLGSRAAGQPHCFPFQLHVAALQVPVCGGEVRHIIPAHKDAFPRARP